MSFISEHFEIIDLYHLTCDSQWNVETDPVLIDRMFLDGLAIEVAKGMEIDNVPDNDR